MKLIDKQIVEATSPTIHLGRRPIATSGPARNVSGPTGRVFYPWQQYQESLKTSNKAAALRRAYALAEPSSEVKQCADTADHPGPS
jgi:hypothetical protein